MKKRWKVRVCTDTEGEYTFDGLYGKELQLFLETPLPSNHGNPQPQILNTGTTTEWY
jgi:hypothetical protein